MNPKIPPPLTVAFLAAAMWAVDRELPLSRLESALLAPLAVALAAGGLLLGVLAVIAFIRAGTTINPLRPSRATKLITTGVFRYSRNPVYFADALLLAAWATWLGNVCNYLFLLMFIWIIQRWQIVPEERALLALFGENYTRYCAQVRRWL
jgi:protein-S-isoprenylcysteine O-methyltransferase Ste14